MLDLSFAVVFFLSVGAILAGPPLALVVWKRKREAIPRFFAFLVGSTLALTVLAWTAFAANEWLLELEFREVVPGGSWTAVDEALWSERERQIVRSYFGDGGRILGALFAPIPLAIYSAAVWLLSAAATWALARRRAV